MTEEGDQIPWDAFFWRNGIVQHTTRDEVTTSDIWVPPPQPGVQSNFNFVPNPENFWEMELRALLDRTHSIMFPVAGGFRVWGDGIRLFLPLMWMYDTDEEDMILAIVRGINVSLQNRDILGY